MEWLIDGHNVIGQMPDIGLDDPDDEQKLLWRLRRYRARTGRRIVVVFDPGGAYHPAARRSKGGITVQYAPAGSTADRVIKARLRRAKNPRQIVVVSSDRAVQQAARSVGARVVEATAFAAELAAPPVAPEPDAEPERRLSEAEIAEWLRLFGGEEGGD